MRLGVFTACGIISHNLFHSFIHCVCEQETLTEPVVCSHYHWLKQRLQATSSERELLQFDHWNYLKQLCKWWLNCIASKKELCIIACKSIYTFIYNEHRLMIWAIVVVVLFIKWKHGVLMGRLGWVGLWFIMSTC